VERLIRARVEVSSLISAGEFEVFDRIRGTRNPYVHSRAPLAPGSLEARMTDDVGP
jgi:hypothetical protein